MGLSALAQAHRSKRRPREQGWGARRCGLYCKAKASVSPCKDKGGHYGGRKTKAAALMSGPSRSCSKGVLRARCPPGVHTCVGKDVTHSLADARTRVLSTKCTKGLGAFYARPEP